VFPNVEPTLRRDLLTTSAPRKTEVVGVIGVGGLGHLAIQFAAKMGCHVVALSGTEAKKEEAIKLGAKEFIATKGAKELKVERPLNRLLVSTAAKPDWNLILPLMAPQSTIHPLSIDGGDFQIPYMPLVTKAISVQGSIVASRYVHKRMLEFAALHKIEPVVERFPMTEEGIEEGFKKLADGSIRYRGILIAP